MKSAVLVGNPGSGLRVEVAEKNAPAPAPGEIVVRMQACGLCGTDMEKIKGDYTASLPVIGHEAVGVVSAVGKGVSQFKEGDRVFPHHHVPCYTCHYCISGNETMCERYRGSNLVPGGFSELFTVPRWNVDGGGVLMIPQAMSFDVASLIEPLACCVRAMHRSGVKRGESVLVVGAGPVGMMNALLLKESGAEVLVSDIIENRLDLGARLGVRRGINATKSDVSKEARVETEGMGVDLAVVASGSKSAIIQGLRSIRKGGRVCLFGIPLRNSILDYDVSDLYNSEQSIISSYGAVESDTKKALEILLRDGDTFGRLITHRFPLARLTEAIELATRGDAMKIVITP